jgi:hypothetical protein
MGFSVEDRVPRDSDVKVESGALIELMHYFEEVVTGRRDKDGVPLSWLGAMGSIEEAILGSISCTRGELVVVKEAKLTNALVNILKLINHYMRYLGNDGKKALMDSLAAAALAEYAGVMC